MIDDDALYAETHDVSSDPSQASDDEQPSQIIDVSSTRTTENTNRSALRPSCNEAPAIESAEELGAAGEIYLTVIEIYSD